MGILSSVGEHLLSISPMLGLQGDVLTLGNQDVILFEDQWSALCSKYGVSTNTQKAQTRLIECYNAREPYITAETYFRSLGCSRLVSLDVSRYQGCDILFDLNSSSTPLDLSEKFDVVFDGSTIEHVLLTQNVMTHIFNFLKPGGIVIHVSPVNNMPTDGFYQFSPSFFRQHYANQGFEQVYEKLHTFTLTRGQLPDGRQTLITNDQFHELDSGALDLSNTDGRHCQMIYCARKRTGAYARGAPYQDIYLSDPQWTGIARSRGVLSRLLAKLQRLRAPK